MQLRAATHAVRCSAVLLSSLFLPGCFILGDGSVLDDSGTGGETDDDSGGPVFEHRYFLSQSVLFDGEISGVPIFSYPPGCLNTDILDDISSLRQALEADSWSGITEWDRYLFPNKTLLARPEAWAEEHSHPMFSDLTHPDADADKLQADQYDLSVFTGHGSPGLLHSNAEYAPTPISYSPCEIDITHQVRLGRFCGRKNKVAVFGASCVAAIDQLNCDLGDDFDGDGIGDAPWEPYCWTPLRCTLGQSASNHIMTFADSPVIGNELTRNWYLFAKGVVPVGYSWMAAMMYDGQTDSANQPFVLIQARDEQDAVNRMNASRLSSGQHLDALSIEEIDYQVASYVMYTGKTVFADENGDPIQAWGGIPDDLDSCMLDYTTSCGIVNPSGVGNDECQ